ALGHRATAADHFELVVVAIDPVVDQSRVARLARRDDRTRRQIGGPDGVVDDELTDGLRCFASVSQTDVEAITRCVECFDDEAIWEISPADATDQWHRHLCGRTAESAGDDGERDAGSKNPPARSDA